MYITGAHRYTPLDIVQGNSKLGHSKVYKHFGFKKTVAAQRAHVYAFKNSFKGLQNSAIPFIM